MQLITTHCIQDTLGNSLFRVVQNGVGASLGRMHFPDVNPGKRHHLCVVAIWSIDRAQNTFRLGFRLWYDNFKAMIVAAFPVNLTPGV